MDKTENRLEFNKVLPKIVESIRLTDTLLNKLKTHEIFANYINTIQAFKTEREKVIYILTEFTQKRSICKNVIQLLREDKQTDGADELEKFNKSPGLIQLSDKVELNVTTTMAPIWEQSNCYALSAHKRGLCVIINNVEEPMNPKWKGLINETERFKSIFKQLFFEVIVFKNLNTDMIRNELNIISQSKTTKQDQAFVLIVISHGQKEKVIGYDACKGIKKLNEDVVNIKELIAIFSEENCVNLRNKPKLHFYICCRIENPGTKNETLNVLSNSQFDEEEPMDYEVDQGDYFVKVWPPKELPGYANMDTSVIYSCAEDALTFFDENSGMTYFGQALTHSIAQYSCDELFSAILSRTSTRLKDIYKGLKSEEDRKFERGEIMVKKYVINSFVIEIISYNMKKQLYFNPGRVEC